MHSDPSYCGKTGMLKQEMPEAKGKHNKQELFLA
jgi:hypothetical protein